MKLAICMVCRNCEKHLEKIFENLKQLEKYTPYLIIEYDNCVDSTEYLIREYTKKIKMHVQIISIKNNNSAYRTERIANARNTCLDFLDTIETDFHIMLDSDDINTGKWNIDVIDHYLSRDDWDCISFNGDNSNENTGDYYDKWALYVDDFRWHCWGFGNASIHVIRGLEKYITDKLNNNSEVECHSAFNGFAIYRTRNFKGIRYKGLISQIDPKFFKKSDINKSITFVEKLPYVINYSKITGSYVEVHYPLNTEKNSSDVLSTSSGIQCIYPNEICEHIHYHVSAKRKNGAVIKISNKNLQKNI